LSAEAQAPLYAQARRMLSEDVLLGREFADGAVPLQLRSALGADGTDVRARMLATAARHGFQAEPAADTGQDPIELQLPDNAWGGRAYWAMREEAGLPALHPREDPLLAQGASAAFVQGWQGARDGQRWLDGMALAQAVTTLGAARTLPRYALDALTQQPTRQVVQAMPTSRALITRPVSRSTPQRTLTRASTSAPLGTEPQPHRSPPPVKPRSAPSAQRSNPSPVAQTRGNALPNIVSTTPYAGESRHVTPQLQSRDPRAGSIVMMSGGDSGQPRNVPAADSDRLLRTGRTFFVTSGFDVASATPQQALDVLADASYAPDTLRAVVHALEQSRPDLAQHGRDADSDAIANRVADTLDLAWESTQRGQVPTELALAFERRAWDHHYQATANNPPSILLSRGVQTFIESQGRRSGVFVDLGSGVGNESKKMLELGWNVVSIDPQPGATRTLGKRINDPAQRIRLTQIEAKVEEAELPSDADIVFAGKTMPHVAPQALPSVLQQVADSLAPGGLFVADFFSTRNRLAGQAHINALDADDIRALLPPSLEVMVLEHDGTIVELIARKRADPVHPSAVRAP
jgi:SAM-dependent methyltransferase